MWLCEFFWCGVVFLGYGYVCLFDFFFFWFCVLGFLKNWVLGGNSVLFCWIWFGFWGIWEWIRWLDCLHVGIGGCCGACLVAVKVCWIGGILGVEGWLWTWNDEFDKFVLVGGEIWVFCDGELTNLDFDSVEIDFIGSWEFWVMFCLVVENMVN